MRHVLMKAEPDGKFLHPEVIGLYHSREEVIEAIESRIGQFEVVDKTTSHGSTFRRITNWTGAVYGIWDVA